MSNALFATVGKGAIVGTIVGVIGSAIWFFKSSSKNKEARQVNNSPVISPKKQHSNRKEKFEDHKEEKEEKDSDDPGEKAEHKKDDADATTENGFEDTNYAFVQDSNILDLLKHIEPYVYVCSSKRYKEFLNDISRVVEIHQLTVNENSDTQLSPSLLYESSKAQEDVKNFFNYVHECYKRKNMNLARNFDDEKKALLEILDAYNNNTRMELQYQVRFKNT